MGHDHTHAYWVRARAAHRGRLEHHFDVAHCTFHLEEPGHANHEFPAHP